MNGCARRPSSLGIENASANGVDRRELLVLRPVRQSLLHSRPPRAYLITISTFFVVPDTFLCHQHACRVSRLRYVRNYTQSYLSLSWRTRMMATNAPAPINPPDEKDTASDGKPESLADRNATYDHAQLPGAPNNTAGPPGGPIPNGGIKAWIQVLSSWMLFFNTWCEIARVPWVLSASLPTDIVV